MRREPTPTPFAKQALKYFQRLYEGRSLPEGEALLNAIQRVVFPGKRKLSAEEARWVAQQLIEQRRPSTAGVLWRIFTRPEEASPQTDMTQPAREVSAVEALANILRTPQRALQATVIPKGKPYGKEAGKPTVARSWAEAFASDPTWGSVLEALFPDSSRRMRQVAGILGDIFIDPLLLLGIIGKGAQASSIMSRGAKAARSLSESSSSLLRKAGSVLSSELPSLSFLDRAASENLARMLGINAAEAAASNSPLRLLGLLFNWALDPAVTSAAVQEAKQAPKGQRLSKAFASLAQAHELRRRVAESGPVASREMIAQKHRFRGLPQEAMEYARKAVSELDESHPDVQSLRRVEERMSKTREGISYAPAEDVESVYRLARQAGWTPKDREIPSIREIAQQVEKETGELSRAAKAEQERLQKLARHSADIADKALSLWKATKTVMNPPSFVRNFFQNFILRYIEGENIDPARLAAAVARLLKDPERFKTLWKSTGAEGTVQDVGRSAFGGWLGRAIDELGKWYEGADRLAAVIMSEATGKPPTEFLMNYGQIPQTLEFLRRRGIAPFIAWQYFAVPAVVRGMVNNPARSRQVLQAITALQPSPHKRGQSVQVGDREIRLGNILPINPADYGGEMQILDPRNAPWFSAADALRKLYFSQGRERGYRPMGGNQPLQGWEGLAAFLKDFWMPPALGYYLPGLVSPPQPRMGERKPREQIDYALGLLGVPTRPVDEQADLRSAAWKQIEENRQRAQQMMRMLHGMGERH